MSCCHSHRVRLFEKLMGRKQRDLGWALPISGGKFSKTVRVNCGLASLVALLFVLMGTNAIAGASGPRSFSAQSDGTGSNLLETVSGGDEYRVEGDGEGPRGRECFVWFEVNSMQQLPQLLKYATQWMELGSLVVTSTSPNVLKVVRTLQSRGFKVISGFKTRDFFKRADFEDAAAWQAIAILATELAELTAGRPVVLENEGTVKAMLKAGITSVDSEALMSSISNQAWPEIWFWYAPEGLREPVRSITLDIARAVKRGIGASRLIEASSAGFRIPRRQQIVNDNLQRTLSLEGSPISIIYLDDYAERFWPFSKLRKAVSTAVGQTIIIYPGYDDIAFVNNRVITAESVNCVPGAN